MNHKRKNIAKIMPSDYMFMFRKPKRPPGKQLRVINDIPVGSSFRHTTITKVVKDVCPFIVMSMFSDARYNKN